MTAYDVREILVRTIMRHNGGQMMRWRRVFGEIRVYPLSTHPHCNWRADPSGSVREVELAERTIDLVSAKHPIVE